MSGLFFILEQIKPTMKKSVYLLMAMAAILSSCGGETEKKTEPGKKDSVKTEKPKNTFDTQKLVGQYMGEFGKSTIIISINYISGKNTSGYDLVRGNRRNIKGSLEPEGGKFHFKMDEPGNDSYDGKFDFTIDTATFELTGSWEPYKKDEKVTGKTYTLKPLEKFTDTTNEFYGDWSGYNDETSMEGSLTIKNDGSFTYKGYYYGENENLENEFSIKGTWIKDNKKVTLEFDRNPYMPVSKMKCMIEKTEYGYEMRSGESAQFSKYMPSAYPEEY